MKTTDIAYLRLYNQLICHQSHQHPKEVIRWMVALQAQDYRSSLWAIGLRASPTLSIRETMVEKAIADREIVRTWPMRGTLHWVAATDVRWMLRLLTPRIIKGSAGRYRPLELDGSSFLKSSLVIEKALAGGKALSRPELYGIMEQAGIHTPDQRGIHILGHLAMEGLICLGPKAGNQHTFVLLDEWLPAYKKLDREEGLANLAARYFKSHGPATVYDFATWAGIKVSDARKGLEQVQSGLEQASIEGQVYWFPEPEKDMESIVDGEQAWLLPAFDEMLCGYKDKSAILESASQKTTILKNGIIRPILVIGNKAVGAWKRSIKKNQVIFELFPFAGLEHRHEEAIKEQAKRLGRFLEKEVVLIGL